MNFTSFLDTQLNEQQRAAVTHEQGPVLVIAGAGSGKTRIITARIAHLIVNKQVAPATIVALTFTNKAAQEMRERIAAFIGQQSQQPFLGTFHAYCLRLLREYGSFIGLKSFGILDEIDQEALVKKILGPANNRHITPRQAVHQLSLLKNSAIIDLSELSLMDDYTRELYQRYEAEKKLSNCLDFDDLLLYTIKLFEHVEFKKIIRNQVRHVLVDEYQDTNVVQHVLLKHLALEKNTCIIDSLCVVGDEDQAIYSWRGATIENITQFSNQITGTTLVTIEQNYRSAKQILDAANQIITHNTNRHPKKLWSTRTGKNCIVQLACASDNQEAELVARAAAITRQHKTSTTLAVLYRAHFQSRAIEEALVRHSIPYRIIGGVQFYERKEVKDILAYVRLVANPFDRIAFARVINCPTRALGEKFIELFFECWQQNPFCTYQEIAQKLIQNNALKPQQDKNLNNFLSIFMELGPTNPAQTSISTIIERTNYIDYLRDTYDKQEAHERTQNIKELINAAHFFENRAINTVDLFLQEVALLQERPKKEAPNAVQLMTIHAAKGLEFDTVIITGLEEGIFPSLRSLDVQASIEEERRLLYVGITRAKNKLLLSWAENRYVFGSAQYQTQSRFLKELPDKTPVEHYSTHNEYTLKCFLQNFFEMPVQQTMQVFASKKVQQVQPKHTLPDWKPLQPVNHSTFGIGIIQAVEHTRDTIILTIQFKEHTKRIASSFVAPL